MKRIKVGDVYSAHLYTDGVRHSDAGYYHFKMLSKKYCHGKNGKRWFFLGMKLDVDYSNEHPQCFWFDNDGINQCALGFPEKIHRFKLKRKVKKEERDYARFEGFDYE